MKHNPFDKASRYAAQLDPEAYLAWVLGLPPAAFQFRRWLDTRLVHIPGGSERISDTVAELHEVAGGGVPWAVILEFQIRPDAELFGRLLVYLGTLWLQQRPSPERGDRYALGAAIVNLTGSGNNSRSYEWDEAKLGLTLRARERNLATEDAATTLDSIARGDVGRCVLPWLALMQGGSEPAVLARWLEVARAEPHSRRRSDYGSLALIFAEAADCRSAWEDALKGWNMIESQVVNEWINEGRTEGRIEGTRSTAKTLLVNLLHIRFGAVPPDLESAVQQMDDVTALQQLFERAARAGSLDEFRSGAAL